MCNDIYQTYLVAVQCNIPLNAKIIYLRWYLYMTLHIYTSWGTSFSVPRKLLTICIYAEGNGNCCDCDPRVQMYTYHSMNKLSYVWLNKTRCLKEGMQLRSSVCLRACPGLQQRTQSSKHTTKPSTTNLTHLPLDKMDVISQAIFSDAFWEWKVLYFLFHWSMFIRAQLAINKNLFR